MFLNYIIENIDLVNKLLEIETIKLFIILYIFLVSILELNMMSAIDFHVPVLQLHMDNKLNFKVLLYKMLHIQLVVAQWI